MEKRHIRALIQDHPSGVILEDRLRDALIDTDLGSSVEYVTVSEIAGDTVYWDVCIETEDGFECKDHHLEEVQSSGVAGFAGLVIAPQDEQYLTGTKREQMEVVCNHLLNTGEYALAAVVKSALLDLPETR